MQSPTIDQAAELLRGRLAELDSERDQVEKALNALSSNGNGPTRRTRRGSSKRGSRKGSTRAAQAVDLIIKNPGITASDIARTMKIKPNYLYRVLGDLEKEKLVKKKGRKYEPGAKASKAAAVASS